jgi:hypothetical protein
MVTAAEYVLAYQDQTGSDGSDSVELLTDFLISYGMTDATIEALCQLIDEEGIAMDLVRQLRENGLVTETDDQIEDDDGLADLA